MAVEIFDISNYLKNAFVGRVINVPGGLQTVDGGYIYWFPIELFFGDVNGQPLDVTYGETQQSSLPAKIQTEEHLLYNCRNIDDSRRYTLTSSYTETTTVSRSKTLVEGRSVTIKADAALNIGVVRASAGISETKNVSLTSTEATTVVRTETKSETFPYDEKVLARTYRVISSRRELANYETAFEGTLVIDGRVLLQTIRKDAVDPRIDCGAISDYLSIPERTIKASGLISNIIGGKLTFGSSPDLPIEERPELCAVSASHFSGLSNGLADLGWNAITAEVDVLSIDNSVPNGWQATFNVTVACPASSCAGFDVMLNYVGGEQQLVSVDGWNTAESAGGNFQIVRGNYASAGEELATIMVMGPVVAICDD